MTSRELLFKVRRTKNREEMKNIKKVLGYFLILAIYLIGIYIFKIRNRIKITGRENIPPGSRILYLSNHQTLIDSLLIALGTSTLRQVIFKQSSVAWNAPDRKNFLDKGFSKFFFELLKTVPTDRNIRTQKDIERQISSYCRILEDNNLVLFFEGTRTRDGSIGDCKKGVVLTILKAKPNYVVPITLINIGQIMPIEVGFNYLKIKSGFRGEMIIGKPIEFDSQEIELIGQRIKAEIKKNHK